MSRPWMPLYVADYLLDTRDLTADQHGVYLLLLMLSWRRPSGTLPNDDGWLRSNLPPMHGRTFNSLVPPLLTRFFTLNEAGEYENKRLRNEIEKSSKFSRKQSENASKRWEKESKGLAADNNNKDLADATAMPARALHSQSHSQSQSHKNSEPIGSGAVAPVDHRKRLFDEGLPKIKALTGKGEDACRSFLGKCLKAADDNAITVLGLIEDAERNQAIDPTAWIVARLKSRENFNGRRTVHDAARDLTSYLKSLDEPAPSLCEPAGGNPVRLLPARGRE